MDRKVIKKLIINEIFDRFILKNELFNIMMDYDSYMCWIEEYMKENDFFSNQPNHFNDYLVSMYDLDNMTKLDYFYEIINQYASLINITPYSLESGNYYLLKYNDNGYRITCLNNQLYLCEKVELLDYVYFIDYNEISNNYSLKKIN